VLPWVRRHQHKLNPSNRAFRVDATLDQHASESERLWATQRQAKVPVTGTTYMYFPFKLLGTEDYSPSIRYGMKVPDCHWLQLRLCDSSRQPGCAMITSLACWSDHGAEEVGALDAENLLMRIIECSSEAIWRYYEVRETVIGPRDVSTARSDTVSSA
jgi:hypothetical protein